MAFWTVCIIEDAEVVRLLVGCAVDSPKNILGEVVSETFPLSN